ncbi:MAG: class I tRNA ligase family protein, partial [Candidatus Aureabacteria bacterium]|nr:class I tRNA ligase family protein [Candidatus Auribacterota bacterium]
LAAILRRDMEALRLSAALERIWAAVGFCNRYIDESAPWKLRKDPARADRFAAVVYNLCEALRIIAILISPFMPATAASIRSQLGLGGEIAFGALREAETFGLLTPGAPIGEVKAIFPRKENSK